MRIFNFYVLLLYNFKNQIVNPQKFTKFVSKLVKIRVQNVGSNEARGQRAKLVLNSAVGRFGLNLEKYRKTSFAKKENLRRHINTPLLDNHFELQSEYPVDIHLVSKRKRKENDRVPVHLSCFIYQRSKLWFFKFVLVLFDYLKPYHFKLCYMARVTKQCFNLHDL